MFWLLLFRTFSLSIKHKYLSIVNLYLFIFPINNFTIGTGQIIKILENDQ